MGHGLAILGISMSASVSHSDATLHHTPVPSLASKAWLHLAWLFQTALVQAPAMTAEGPPKPVWAGHAMPRLTGLQGTGDPWQSSL